ncbi:hypothetical protein PG996_011958 [Apiospora saccharicola]|uniref:Uncharacterized protein n=1 Tax=Apiospora saccharicola TaxID=335842 RepID=A0ABR1U1S2_9PEZI
MPYAIDKLLGATGLNFLNWSALKSVITTEILNRDLVDVTYVENKITLMRDSIEQSISQKLENTIEAKLELLRKELQDLGE